MSKDTEMVRRIRIGIGGNGKLMTETGVRVLPVGVHRSQAVKYYLLGVCTAFSVSFVETSFMSGALATTAAVIGAISGAHTAVYRLVKDAHYGEILIIKSVKDGLWRTKGNVLMCSEETYRILIKKFLILFLLAAIALTIVAHPVVRLLCGVVTHISGWVIGAYSIESSILYGGRRREDIS